MPEAGRNWTKRSSHWRLAVERVSQPSGQVLKGGRVYRVMLGTATGLLTADELRELREKIDVALAVQGPGVGHPSTAGPHDAGQRVSEGDVPLPARAAELARGPSGVEQDGSEVWRARHERVDPAADS